MALACHENGHLKYLICADSFFFAKEPVIDIHSTVLNIKTARGQLLYTLARSMH